MNERQWDKIKEEARKLVELTPQIRLYLDKTINGQKNEAIQACGQDDAIYDFSLGFNFLYDEIKKLKEENEIGRVNYFGEVDCKTVAMILIVCNSFTDYKMPLYIKATDILSKRQYEAYIEDLEELLSLKKVSPDVRKWSMRNFVMLRDKEYLLEVIA